MALYLTTLALAASAYAQYPTPQILFTGGFDGKVSSLAFDAEAQTLSVRQTTTQAGLSPGYITLSPDRQVLLAADEDVGQVTAFNISADGQLDFVEQVPSGGKGTVTVGYNSAATRIVTANYFDASIAAWDAQEDGTPLKASGQYKKLELATPGPVTDRQDKPYPHQAKYDTTGRFWFVPDLGSDIIGVYDDNTLSGRFESILNISLPLGHGPRHIDFRQAPDSAPDSPPTHAYIICELSNTVEVFSLAYDLVTPSIVATHVQSVTTVIDGFPEGTTGAASELAIDHQRHVLYAGNRFRSTTDGSVPLITDQVATYDISLTNCTLTPRAMLSLGARNVRMLELDSTATYMAVAGQESGEAVVFAVEGWVEVARAAVKAVSVVRWV